MCIVLYPDIIVASQISELGAHLKLSRNKNRKNQIDAIRKLNITISNCLERQEASKEIGLSNVIAESTIEKYRDFFDNNKLFMWIEHDRYQLKKEALTTLLDENSTFTNQLKILYKHIIKSSYKRETLRYLNVL